MRCDTEATRKAVCELLPSVDPRRIVLLRDALTLTPPDEDVSMPPSNVPEPLQLLAVGTMTSRKGYDTLLQACLALQKAGVDFRLTLVGTGVCGCLPGALACASSSPSPVSCRTRP